MGQQASLQIGTAYANSSEAIAARPLAEPLWRHGYRVLRDGCQGADSDVDAADTRGYPGAN